MSYQSVGRGRSRGRSIPSSNSSHSPPYMGRGRGRGRGTISSNRHGAPWEQSSSIGGRGRGSGDRDNNHNHGHGHPPSFQNHNRDSRGRGHSHERDSTTRSGMGRGRGTSSGGVVDNRPAWMTQREKHTADFSTKQGRKDTNHKDKDRDRDKDSSMIITPSASTSTSQHSTPSVEEEEKDSEQDLLLLQQFADAEEEALEQGLASPTLLDTEENKANKARLKRQERKRAIMEKFKDDENDAQQNKKIKHSTVKEEEEEEEEGMIVVDEPRNAAGIIASEAEDRITMLSKELTHNVIDKSNATPAESNDTPSSSSSSDFDMFNDDIDTPTDIQMNNYKFNPTANSGIVKTGDVGEDFDDGEGYYKSTIGEIIHFTINTAHHSDDYDNNSTRISFKVLGGIGKGVFSTVVKCVSADETNNISNSQQQQDVVAMKLIRNNETMAKAAQKEVRILRLLCNSKTNNTTNNNHNIVRFLNYHKTPTSSTPPILEHRNHTVLLFEYLPYNLRQILAKFGHKVGINLTAVRSYAKQLFSALGHLRNHGIVHADIKPDNILVSADYSMVKLCDFGSAFFYETDVDGNDPTPYLVSRFYRPPEVILGLEYDYQVDLWSVAVTLAELFMGEVLFPGKTNNDMLKRFMDAMGPFSNKILRRHFGSYQRMNLQMHFQKETYQFLQQTVDKVTGRNVVRVVTVTKPVIAKTLPKVLVGARSGTEERGELLKMADLVGKCLTLDPAKRIGVEHVLDHDFFVKRKKIEKRPPQEEEEKPVIVEPIIQ